MTTMTFADARLASLDGFRVEIDAAAERADAAFDPERIRRCDGDAARIVAAVVGIVDLAGPFVRP